MTRVKRYWDYLRALQRFRVEHPYQPHLVTAASYFVDYPVFPRQRNFTHPPADVTVERISDLLGYQLPAVLAVQPSTAYVDGGPDGADHGDRRAETP